MVSYEQWMSSAYNMTSAFGNFKNPLSDFFHSEMEKSDLRDAEARQIASGLPIVGDLLKGQDGISQLEDLYAKTGKTAQYAAVQNTGAASLGHFAGTLANQVANGFNDLYQYYSGEPDAFRSEMNNSYM